MITFMVFLVLFASAYGTDIVVFASSNKMNNNTSKLIVIQFLLKNFAVLYIIYFYLNLISERIPDVKSPEVYLVIFLIYNSFNIVAYLVGVKKIGARILDFSFVVYTLVFMYLNFILTVMLLSP